MKKIKILITGGCGFVGTNLAVYLNKYFKIECMDNLSRKGSRYNRGILKLNKIKNYNFDILNFRKILKLPKYDLIIDCCAEAAVEVSRNDIEYIFGLNYWDDADKVKSIQKEIKKNNVAVCTTQGWDEIRL